MKKKHILFLFPVLISGLLCSCQKQYLAAPTDKSLVVPTTLSDFQLLLNNEQVINITPALGVISSDDYYTTDDGWQGFTLNADKNSYIWSPDIFQGESDADWNIPYQQVFYANVVLDGLSKLNNNGGDPATYNRIKGSALFYRAHAFYQLAQLFAAPFSAESVGLPGVPIRTSSEVKTRSERGTLQQTYSQILADLTLAGKLLPVQTAFKTRPDKAAVYGLFSRVYQTMQDYQNAKRYADSCLQLNHTLVDYNTLDTTSYAPMPSPLSANENEVIYDSEFIAYSFISYNPLTIVDSALYRSYSTNDLRKPVFFTDNGYGAGQFNFKGSYCGSSSISSGQFGGIATDEIYLIRAECEARSGDVTAALNDLNTLLKTRWKTGTFVPAAAVDKDAALSIILNERRKELVSRGLRFADLRRLNQDPHFAVTLKRLLNGETYTLSPGSKLYTLPIAQDEIASSGFQQNPR
jgi:starch-binding outer membrane protein, SusD/RagB family